LGYWGAAIVIALMGWTLYSATVETRESAQRVERSLQSLQRIGMAGESIARAEAAQRGYLLTGDEAFAADRERAIAQVHTDIGNLAGLDLDSAGRAKVARIQELAAARIELTETRTRRLA
jgi:CHASE3 domain sensor protein